MYTINTTYTRWKSMALSLGIATYHVYVGRDFTSANHDFVAIYCGNLENIVRSTVSGSVETTWTTDFPNSVVCIDEDEAAAAVLGNFLPIRLLGNITTTSASEVLVTSRAYVEPASQAQRSIKSTSATDSNGAATGARQVRLTYLDSNYIRKTEDIFTNGTTAVATAASDIRFVESMDVIKGVAAVGAVELWTNNNGTGSVICGIAAATSQTFMCHHYVPASTRAWITSWGATVDDEANLKLLTQDRFNSNLVDRVSDLEKLAGIATPPGRLFFDRELQGVVVPEKTYIRITVAPLQATSTVTRARLLVYEAPF